MEAYWLYLQQLTQSRLLRFKHDVFDRRGGVACKAGDLVSPALLDRLRHLQALENIEDTLTFGDLCHESWLEQSLLAFVRDDESCAQYLTPQFTAELQEACHWVQRYPQLLFRLQVLSRARPLVFDRALFCGWLGLLLYGTLKHDLEHKKNLFLASLIHDVGLLDLDESLLPQRNARHVAHPSAYYDHVLFSARFTQRLALPEAISKAVMQHHETIDGTGYPNGLYGMNLNPIGQVINMFDSLFMIYARQFRPVGRGLCDLVPIVEMNSVTRFGNSAKQLIDILKSGKRTQKTDVDINRVKQQVAVVTHLFAYVQSANDAIQSFTNRVGFRHDDKALSALQNGFFHIALEIHKSEKINEDFMASIAHASEQELYTNSRDIEDAGLMMKEVVFHINQFAQQLHMYLPICRSAQVIDAAQETLQKLQQSRIESEPQTELP